MRTVLLSTILFAAPALLAQHRLLDGADLDGRQTAARDLASTLAESRDLPTTIALAAIAGTNLPAGSAARAGLEIALRTANLAAQDTALAPLRLALGDLVETLTFEPLRQAELPKGFPGFQAVDEIELRHYPAYRMVRTDMTGGSTRAFWPLFRHIESNGIAMTTPVQMDWQAADQTAAVRPMQMAFLYGDPAIEPKHIADGVEVVARPAITVLSIGAIGDDRRERIEALRERLEDFLATTDAGWTAAGPLRTMGYNSPMVSRDRRYFEVQLPVRQTAPQAAPRILGTDPRTGSPR